MNGKIVPIPVNIDTVNELFDDIHLEDSLEQQQGGVFRSISRLLFGTSQGTKTSEIRTTAEMDEWLKNIKLNKITLFAYQSFFFL